MNNFCDLTLKFSYDSGKDDILSEFYIPVLSKANQYDRIAGFFSSSSLALAARGMEQFIINGGKMRLVTCPKLQGNDIRIIDDLIESVDKILYRDFIKSYNEIEDKFQKDHIKALGWMIANGLLEIKIAIVTKNGMLCSTNEINELGIMHQKVGVLYDQAGNIISFSGSNNESASGWLGNTEEFKTFCSWQGMMPYISEDILKFKSFWNNERDDVVLKDLPEAIKEKIITESKDFEPTLIANNKYSKNYTKLSNISNTKEKLSLFPYQKKAIVKWKENNYSLLLQMATGTGKTRTSIGCIDIITKQEKCSLIVIACPQVTLAKQWQTEIDKLDINVCHSLVINGNILNWQNLLKNDLLKLLVGFYKNIVLYATHQICSSEKFISIIKDKKFCKIKKFFIGDEVHGLGALKNQNSLVSEYIYRLGLSATPQRWFDEDGTKILLDYFGNKSFEFSIKDALNTINPITGRPFLVNYYYLPYFVSLNEDEMTEYNRLTERLVKMRYLKDNKEQFIQMVRFARANIEKNAENKYKQLEFILDDIGSDITDTIIFVSEAQIDRVISILGKRGIFASRFTKDQGTVPSVQFNGMSERDYIIDLFKKKKYKVLVAIKCLDEGIDIPSANTAIIMASSTNPREYVQRIGRIIRQAPGKREAKLYDLILRPNLSRMNDKLIEVEKRIFEKEMIRVEDLSENALNNVTIINMLYKIKSEVLI